MKPADECAFDAGSKSKNGVKGKIRYGNGEAEIKFICGSNSV
ncbi:hypothetical protein l11_06060 [Neisseria weaveri LMG 5135]|nr:hypothetical protein l11_06060 [Neisseria weaveri LMG 5135]